MKDDQLKYKEEMMKLGFEINKLKDSLSETNTVNTFSDAIMLHRGSTSRRSTKVVPLLYNAVKKQLSMKMGAT